MKRSVRLPLRTESINVSNRFGHPMARASMAKSQRNTVAMVLGHRDFGAKPTAYEINAGMRVTLTRISSGTLDFVNLCGSQKHVQDQVAAWVGVSDRDSRIEWTFEQQKCERGYQGVRITVECSRDGADVDLDVGSGVSPCRLGPASETGEGELPRKEHGNDPRRRTDRAAIARVSSVVPRPRTPTRGQAPGQVEIAFRRSHAMLPWDQDGSGEPVVTELGIAADGTEPPARIRVDVPPLVRNLHAHSRSAIMRLAARTVQLERHLVTHPDIGEAWVYAERGCAELEFFRQAVAAE